MIGITRYFLSITVIHFCRYTIMKLDIFVSYGFAKILHDYFVSFILIKPFHAPCEFGVLVKLYNITLLAGVFFILLLHSSVGHSICVDTLVAERGTPGGGLLLLPLVIKGEELVDVRAAVRFCRYFDTLLFRPPE